MKRKKLFLSALALGVTGIALGIILFFAAGGSAKRGKRPVVAPVLIAGIEYRAPNMTERQGVVEAWDTRINKLLWQKKVYSMVKIPFIIEEDNQWNFITGMTVSSNANELVIINERGGQYVLNIISRKAKRTKGSVLAGW